MRKGTKVIYNNMLFEVLEKKKSHVIIYDPGAKYPELTKIATGINNVKKA